MAERLTAIVDADVGGFMRGMSRVDRQMGATARGMSSVGRGMVGLGRVGGMALGGMAVAGGAAAVGVGVLGIKFGMMKQQALTSFKVLLGSGAKAQKMFADLNKFAADTPFEFPELAGAAQRMLAMGWASKKILPDLRVIGDAAAAAPEGMTVGLQRITTALGQMRAKGKVSAEEMMQLTEAGIPAWKMLADAMGTSVGEAQKEVTKGTVDADRAITALLAGMKKKYGGMMKEQAKTLGGSLSTLKDNFSQAAGTLLEPLMPVLTRWTQMLSTALASPEGQAALATLGGYVRQFAAAAEATVSWVVAHWPQISAVVSQVVAVVQQVIGTARGLIVQHWGAITAAGQQFVAWATGTLWPSVSNVVDMLIALWERFGPTITAAVTAAVQNIGTAIDTIVQVVGHLADAVSAVLSGDWSAAWASAKAAVSAAIDGVRTVVGRTKEVVGTALRKAADWGVEKLGEGLDKAGPAVEKALAAAWESVKSGAAWDAAAGVASDLADYAGEQLGKALGALGGLITSGLQKAFDAVTSISWGVSFTMGSKTFGLGPAPDITIPYPTGISFGAQGGRFSDIAIIGEQPGHSEWVIPENPAYRSRALGLLMGAAGALGVPMLARGGGPRLSSHAVNFKKWGRYGLSAQERFAQGYSDDTALYLRAFQRDGTMSPGEWKTYIRRLQNYRRMLGRLYGTYQAQAGAKLPAKGDSDESRKRYETAKDKRDTARSKRDETRRALLSIVQDIADAQQGARPEPRPTGLAGIAGLEGIDQQLALVDAGLGPRGATRAGLLRQKKALLMRAFRGAKTQAERAEIAQAISAVNSEIAQTGSRTTPPGAIGGGLDGGIDTGGGIVSGGGGFGGGGPTSITNTLNLSVGGNIVSERDIGDAVLRLFVEWARSGKAPLAQVGFGG